MVIFRSLMTEELHHTKTRYENYLWWEKYCIGDYIEIMLNVSNTFKWNEECDLLNTEKKSIVFYFYAEMVDFGESDKMIKISGKVDKSNTYYEFTRNISFFIQGRTSSD